MVTSAEVARLGYTVPETQASHALEVRLKNRRTGDLQGSPWDFHGTFPRKIMDPKENHGFSMFSWDPSTLEFMFFLMESALQGFQEVRYIVWVWRRTSRHGGETPSYSDVVSSSY